MAVATLRTALDAPAVTALVPLERITPLMRPQSIETPAITLTRISMIPANILNGSPNLHDNRVQLSIWDTDYTRARSIAAACKSTLEGTYLLNVEVDQYEPDTDPELYQIIQEWSVWT